MPHPDENLTLPARDFMEAAEAISWIGYGRALRKHQWCADLIGLSRDWDFHDGIGISTTDLMGFDFGEPWYFGAGELLATFKARASGSDWPRLSRIKTEEEGPKFADQYLARYRISDSSGWTALYHQLRADIERRNEFLAELTAAAGRLRRELYKATLIAWGRKYLGQFKSGARRQKLIPEEFSPGVQIDFDGYVREQGSGARALWESLSFDTEEVLATWPPSLFQSATSTMFGDGPQSLSTSDGVLGWLLNFARSEMARVGAPPKRDETLKACQNGTGCTYREARTAWDSLPADLKRKPRSIKPLIGTR